MDVGALYNSITLSVSLTALAMSSVLTVRQLRTARTASQDANITQALLCLNGEYRSDEFRESEDFVLHRLAEECSSDLGVADLPFEARRHVCRVGHFYGDYGMLAALPTYDQARILGCVHYRVREAWSVLEPFAVAERQVRGNSYWSYFENLAFLATKVDKQQVLDSQGLRRFDGARWPSVG
ncbi:hypothetical protein [Actinoplanes friuliensis]|uniref:Uncharacterized protein n=1 Tax=Actinoplanes friuliensis DSM 7358 TaxID=1246995 RepID=U5WAM2_9ACTN|nr:hypothetical protein [Actinoplanes friuliensis]AGZ45001.1 hypothetical protein AFR_33715 [Actinoplanes friuliensis DSM 7358]